MCSGHERLSVDQNPVSDFTQKRGTQGDCPSSCQHGRLYFKTNPAPETGITGAGRLRSPTLSGDSAAQSHPSCPPMHSKIASDSFWAIFEEQIAPHRHQALRGKVRRTLRFLDKTQGNLNITKHPAQPGRPTQGELNITAPHAASSKTGCARQL
jgi:hypothetical protein